MAREEPPQKGPEKSLGKGLEQRPEKLVELYLQGETQVCDRLLSDGRYRQKVERLAQKNSAGTSLSWEDAAQEAQKKVLLAARSGKFRQGGVKEFYSWAAAIALNCIKDLVRKERRRMNCQSLSQTIPGTEIALEETIADDFNSWDAVERANLALQVREAIETINRRYPGKKYLQLWQGLLEDKTQSQLAADLGVQQPAVSKIQKELLRRVAAELGLVTVDRVRREQQAIHQGKGKSPGSSKPASDNKETVKLPNPVKLRSAVEAIARSEPSQNYLQLWQGLIKGKTQKQLTADLGISQSEVSKRRKQLCQRLAENLGATPAGVEIVLRDMQRQARQRDRSDARW
ncbi:MAG: sigma-70 family RNA polymerase sigma factor [Oscillatoria sp. SIO1A7]|nr:sigma-70 family RNA polymerase sigma factor [Oscillatoria sp. SIO1A7]